jgi:hypothetical protein
VYVCGVSETRRCASRRAGSQQRAEAALAAARAMGESNARSSAPKDERAATAALASAAAAAPAAKASKGGRKSAKSTTTQGNAGDAGDVTLSMCARSARGTRVHPSASRDVLTHVCVHAVVRVPFCVMCALPHSVLGEDADSKPAKRAAPNSGGSGERSSVSAPGPDFWSWTPPPAPAPGLAPQRAPAPAARPAAEVLDRPAPATLPPLQSMVEAPSWQEALLAQLRAPAPPLQSASATVGATVSATAAAAATPAAAAAAATSAADVSAALAGAAAALRHAAVGAPGSAPASGTLADGSRWWSESGTEEQAAGRLCRWTVVRGVSGDGGTEWQEKWWETSDSWNYRELGAEKSGRDASGRVWREAWSEVYDPDRVTGLGHIRRAADKWATAADGASWHEEWREAFWADGRTERDAAKWGAVAPGVIPEDGHAGVWHEKWGERWDARGGAAKWTDKWAERAEREGGGPPRRWGDKWTQEFRNGKGGRWGETWSDDPGGAGAYSRKWSEDHYGDGSVRKWGQSTDGQAWEHVAQEDTWYEGEPNFGWADAHRHSPQLLAGATTPCAYAPYVRQGARSLLLALLSFFACNAALLRALCCRADTCGCARACARGCACSRSQCRCGRARRPRRAAACSSRRARGAPFRSRSRPRTRRPRRSECAIPTFFQPFTAAFGGCQLACAWSATTDACGRLH